MKMLQSAICCATLAALAAPVAAFETNARLSGDQARARAAARPFSTYAKVALYYRSGFGVLASKNVANVYEPEVGYVCVVPSVTVDPAATFPQVTVEWGFSLGSALLSYAEVTFKCQPGEFEVHNFDFNAGGAPVDSNNVAFYLSVI